MERSSTSSSTGSSQSLPTGSFQSQTGSFENQPPKRTRKRGIAALLGDSTNLPATSEDLERRACKEIAETKIAVSSAPQHDQRGDSKKGVRTKQHMQAGSACDDDTLCRIFKNNRELFNNGQEKIKNFVSKSVSWEVQKAMAIQIMTEAMTELDMGIIEAAKLAASATGFSHEVVRRWAFAFFCTLSQYPGSLEDIDSEYISMELSSDRGKACGNATSILHDEEFQLAARSYVRSTAYRKGEPNLTTQMFCQWAKEKFSIEICTETARRWLHHLGFNICNHQKGVFFDGHEREDVVAYRTVFLETLAKLDETTITPAQPSQCVEDGKQRHIRVVHDESTFYANADQTRFWNDGEAQVLRQKSLGSSIMLSDFLVEGNGYLEDENDSARLYLETNKDGYFNNDMFIKQVKVAIDIFERKFPHTTGIFLFDNAPSHKKYPPDGLSAANMHVYPGGKQAVMRDTKWNGEVQSMVLSDGTPKGMKLVLQERGTDVKGMTADKMREILGAHPDFSSQTTIVEEVVQNRGHICLFYPKYHCELNPIERNWCHAKRVARQYVN